MMELAQYGIAIFSVGGVSVVINTLNVNSQSNSAESVATATIDEIERALAEKLNFNTRGRGGK